MRLVKAGGKGYDVTEGVQKVAKAFNCIPVEGKFSLLFPYVCCQDLNITFFVAFIGNII